jgi:hypothetical protein
MARLSRRSREMVMEKKVYCSKATSSGLTVPCLTEISRDP